MASRLHDIQPGEVSLVKRGANRRRFLLAKTDGELDTQVAEMLAVPAEREAAFLDAVRNNGGDEGVEKAAATAARALAALREAYGDSLPVEVLKAAQKQMSDDDLLDDSADNSKDDDDDGDGDSPLAKADSDAEHAIYKRDFTTDQRKELATKGHALPNGSYPIESKTDLGPALTLAQSGHGDTTAAKALIKRRASELGATDQLPDEWKLNKEDGMSETAQAVPVKKEDGSWDLTAVAEDQRPAFETLLKAHDDELAELRKQAETETSKADEAIKIAKEERENRETREYIAKSAELTNLAKDDSEFGPVLREIAKAEEAEAISEGSYEKLEAVLKAANEAVAKGDLYSEMGRTGGSGTGSDAETRLDTAAAELRKNDPKLTEAQAIAKAMSINPDLYSAIRKEQA